MLSCLSEFIDYLTEISLILGYSGTLQFGIASLFEPYVRQWLVNTDDKTRHWVDAAISHDKVITSATMSNFVG